MIYIVYCSKHQLEKLRWRAMITTGLFGDTEVELLTPHTCILARGGKKNSEANSRAEAHRKMKEKNPVNKIELFFLHLLV